MKSLVRALFFLSLFLPSVLGQGNPHKTEFQRLITLGKRLEAWRYVEEAYPQFNLTNMRGICMIVDSKEKDPNPQKRFNWIYQRKLLAAARVDVTTETEEEIGVKVSAMWKVAEDLGTGGQATKRNRILISTLPKPMNLKTAMEIN